MRRVDIPPRTARPDQPAKWWPLPPEQGNLLSNRLLDPKGRIPMFQSKTTVVKSSAPAHTSSYCAFLDVLGFTQSIKVHTKAGTHNALLQRFNATLEREIGWFDAQKSGTSLAYKTFSDNVLLAHPVDDMLEDAELGFLVQAIGRYQLRMAVQGFFVRGGLSRGPLYIDISHVFGQALVDAYLLEQEVALDPIVVLDEEVATVAAREVSDFAEHGHPALAALRRRADGRVFVNYLAACIEEVIGEEDAVRVLDATLLAAHKANVEAALVEFCTVPRVFAKYAWLAEYHNHFCAEVQGLPNFHPNLLIHSSLFQQRFSPIA
jgi:hypothetical protein